jgi:uncharacterized protein YeaO (DUF488 family)
MMTKGSLIEYQALKIAQLEQEIERLSNALQAHDEYQEEIKVDAGLKLCDYRYSSWLKNLAPGTNVRVNRSGDPHDPFLFAKIVEIGRHGNEMRVKIDIEGVS